MLSTTTADPPIQVLLVDDDPRLRTLLKEELEDEGYQVSTAADAAGAWDQLNHCSPPDLLVLDWSLPDSSGPEVCQRMREAGITLPVLMLTGHDDVTDRVLALDAGVDDYLVKPFSVEELLARLRALQRRRWEAEVDQPDQLLVLGGLSLNLTAETASLSGTVLPLLKKEYDLLVQLLVADGKAWTSMTRRRDCHKASNTGRSTTVDTACKMRMLISLWRCGVIAAQRFTGTMKAQSKR